MLPSDGRRPGRSSTRLFSQSIFEGSCITVLMADEDVAATEYALTRALKDFDSIMSEEEHALIRLSLRQGRSLSKEIDEKGRLESISKFADSLISSREKVSFAWSDVNEAVAQLQKTWGKYVVKQLDSISTARLKYENFLGRASGLSDILEGVLQELESQEAAQKIIDSLTIMRETEQKIRQATDYHTTTT